MSGVARFRPVLISDRNELADTMSARRDELGITGEHLDHIAGFQERYCAKLELPDAPWGRGSLTVSPPSLTKWGGDVKMTSMGAIWLDALGLKLVLMDGELAQAIGAAPPPPRLPAGEKRTRAQRYRFAKK